VDVVSRGSHDRNADQGGFTLAELLVAMLIIGIVFAGAASALINLTKASVNNERRVQATALAMELHEAFQAMPWGDAVLYEEEVAALSGLAEMSEDGATWNDSPIVTIDESCSNAERGCEWLDAVTVDGRDYRVQRVITWAERAAGSDEAIKRFTTIVRWDVLGRPVKQRLDSERAGTFIDLGIDPEATPTFDVVPSSVQVDADGHIEMSFRLDAVFPSQMSPLVQEVRATLKTEGGSTITVDLKPVLLAETVRRYTFTPPYTDDSGEEVSFPIGTQLVALSYVYDGQPQDMDTPLTFVAPTAPDDGDDTSNGLYAGTIDSATATSPLVDVRRIGNSSNYELCQPLTIQASTTGVTETNGDTVNALFNPTTGPTDVRLGHQGSGLYTHTWAAGSASPWQPLPDVQIEETFRISARDGLSTPAQESNVKDVVVKFRLTGGNQCP